MKQLTTLVAAALLVAGLAAAGPACGPTDPSTAEYWMAQLKTKERQTAIRKLAGMGETAHVAVPALIKLYNQGKDRGDVINALAQLKPPQPEVIELLAKALVDPAEPAAAEAAAAALGEMNAKERARDLIAVLGTEMKDEVKAAALRSLVKLKDPGTVDDLIRILDGDPDKQWVHLNALACEALGEIGMPAAEKGLPAMVRGLFLRDKFQRLAFRECALGLIKLGEPAAKAVLDAMDGKDPVLAELAKTRGFVDGLIVEEGVKMLALLSYRPAATRVLQELVVKNVPPIDYDEKRREMWSIIEAQRFQNSIDTLGRLGDDTVVAELAKWLYKDEYLRRVRVPVALATIGTPAAYAELLKAAKTALVDKDNTWFRIDCAQYLAYIARPENLADLESVLEGLAKIEPELKKTEESSPGAGAKDFLDRVEGFRQNVAAVKECGTSVDCWSGKLTAKHLNVREKAAWTLGRLADPKGLDALLAQVGTSDFELRNAILQVLPLVCDGRCAAPLQKVITDEQGKTAVKGFQDVMLFVLTQVQQRSSSQVAAQK